MLAPIVVFAYNRPNHLFRCIESLLANPESSESSLHIFVDGPKNNLDKVILLSGKITKLILIIKSVLKNKIKLPTKNKKKVLTERLFVIKKTF